MSKMIVSNQVRCQKCGDTPWSGSVHDFSYCKCGSIAVDGGQDYLRRVGNIHGYDELSIEMERNTIDEAIAAVKWADSTGRNERGVVYAVLRSLRDSGVSLAEPDSRLVGNDSGGNESDPRPVTPKAM